MLNADAALSARLMIVCSFSLPFAPPECIINQSTDALIVVTEEQRMTRRRKPRTRWQHGRLHSHQREAEQTLTVVAVALAGSERWQYSYRSYGIGFGFGLGQHGNGSWQRWVGGWY